MYIWEHPQWPEMTWDVDACLGALSAARIAQGRLQSKSEPLGLSRQSELQMHMLVEEAITTSAIEGESLDRAAVRSSVARQLGIPTVGLLPPQRHIDGLVEVLLDATTCADVPLTAERLMGWHAGLFPTGFGGIHRIEVGKWRSGPEAMRVVSGAYGKERVHFVAPPSEQVPNEMAQLLAWWTAPERPTDAILQAALATFWFVTIHPFDDGNGRISRALADMALSREAPRKARLWSLSAQIHHTRKGYYAALEAAQRGSGDITGWMVWFCDCVGEAIRRAEQTLDQVLSKTRFWQENHHIPINERQRKVLNRILDAGPGGFEGGITTRKYARLTRVSAPTAQRDLADLLKKGFLKRLPGGGRSTRYALAWNTPQQT